MCRIMQPGLSSIIPGSSEQHYCSEHSIGFQLKLGSSTKLLAPVFSVSVRTICHTISFLASRTLRSAGASLMTVTGFSLKTFGGKKILLFFWTHCPERFTVIPPKNSVSQLSTATKHHNHQQNTLNIFYWCLLTLLLLVPSIDLSTDVFVVVVVVVVVVVYLFLFVCFILIPHAVWLKHVEFNSNSFSSFICS